MHGASIGTFAVSTSKLVMGTMPAAKLDVRLPVGEERELAATLHANPVDGHEVPVPHFGVVLEMDSWKALADRLRAAGISFVIEPYIRFAGEPGEQATMFFLDPSGNALEFKAFQDIEGELFATGSEDA